MTPPSTTIPSTPLAPERHPLQSHPTSPIRIEIFGAGCGRCRALEKVTHQAVAQLQLNCEVVKTMDPLRFIDLNITAMPALVVGGRLVAMGRLPSLAEMKTLLLGN